MKEIAELYIPDDRRYAPTHEWVKLEGDLMRVGIGASFLPEWNRPSARLSVRQARARRSCGRPERVVLQL